MDGNDRLSIVYRIRGSARVDEQMSSLARASSAGAVVRTLAVVARAGTALTALEGMDLASALAVILAYMLR